MFSIFLPIAGTPFVPAATSSLNHQMYISMRCQPAAVGAGHSLDIQLPISDDFVNQLKRMLGFFSLFSYLAALVC